jgi:hypothetical protein
MSSLDYTIDDNILDNTNKTETVDFKIMKTLPDVIYIENSPEYNKLPFISNGLVYNISNIIPSVEINGNKYFLNGIRSPIPPPENKNSLLTSSNNSSQYPPSLDCFKAIGYDNPIQDSYNSDMVNNSSVSRAIVTLSEHLGYVKYNYKKRFSSDFIYKHNGKSVILDSNTRSVVTIINGCPYALATGWQTLQDALSVLQNYGSCPMEEYYPDLNMSLYEISKKYKIDSYINIYMKGSYSSDANTLINTIKTALYSNGPCLISVMVYNLHGINNDGRIWDPSLVNCGGGIHCMVIIGYDVDKGFLIRNNWGANWPKFRGSDGHTWLPYSDILANNGILEIWRTTNTYSIGYNLKNYSSNKKLYILFILPIVILIMIGYIYKSQISKFLKLYRIS